MALPRHLPAVRDGEKQTAGQPGSFYFGEQDTGSYHSPLDA